MTLKTFPAFLETDAARQQQDAEFIARLKPRAVHIDTLNKLKTFARERYPDEYSSDWRKVLGTPHGREAMQALWAGFLGWREGGEERTNLVPTKLKA